MRKPKKTPVKISPGKTVDLSGYPKYPPKRVTFRQASVDFDPTYDDNGDATNSLIFYLPTAPGEKVGYVERFPSVYNHAQADFSKNFNMVVQEYFLNRRLVSYAEMNLYNFLMNCAGCGYRISIHGKPRRVDSDGQIIDPGTAGLAAVIGCDPKKIVAMIDKLEDLLLLHRVTRMDLRAAPNDLIMHTPFKSAALDQACVSMLVRRVRDHVTLNKKIAARGVDKNGGSLGRFHGKANSFFQFDLREISAGRKIAGQKRQEAFGSHARDFTEWSLIFFKKNLPLLRNYKGDFQKKYRDDLAQMWEQWQIHGKRRREECFIAANKFRTIYCPTMEELCQ